MKRLEPSKTNNQFLIDHSFPGLCSHCHSEIAEFDGSLSNGRPKITKLKNNYDTIQVLLNDGSRMNVVICKPCKEYIRPEDMGKIMENEINGWQKDVDLNPSFDNERKLEYMDYHSKLTIVSRTDIPYDIEQDVKITKPNEKNLVINVSPVKITGGLDVISN